MRASQRGMSYWTILLGVGLFGVIIKLAATVGPIYLDYYTIDKMLQAKFRETQVDKLEVSAFSRDLLAQMERNNIRDRKIEDLMIVRREGSLLLVEMDYEERRKMFGNLDVVVHFKKSYSTEKPDGFVE